MNLSCVGLEDSFNVDGITHKIKATLIIDFLENKYNLEKMSIDGLEHYSSRFYPFITKFLNEACDYAEKKLGRRHG